MVLERLWVCPRTVCIIVIIILCQLLQSTRALSSACHEVTCHAYPKTVPRTSIFSCLHPQQQGFYTSRLQVVHAQTCCSTLAETRWCIETWRNATACGIIACHCMQWHHKSIHLLHKSRKREKRDAPFAPLASCGKTPSWTSVSRHQQAAMVLHNVSKNALAEGLHTTSAHCLLPKQMYSLHAATQSDSVNRLVQATLIFYSCTVCIISK